MKQCSKCKQVKPIDQFANRKRNPDGKKYQCKQCEKDYRDANRDKMKEYREANKERIAKKRAERYKHEYETNELFRIQHSMEKHVKKVNGGSVSRKRLEEVLGCDIEFLGLYLYETAMKNGYEDYREYDGSEYHIVPISTGGTNHFTNLQILSAKDNRAKGNSVAYGV